MPPAHLGLRLRWHDDEARALDVAWRVAQSPGEASALVEVGRQRAVTLLSHPTFAEKVERLAEALLTKRQLTGEQVNDILRKGTMPPKKLDPHPPINLDDMVECVESHVVGVDLDGKRQELIFLRGDRLEKDHPAVKTAGVYWRPFGSSEVTQAKNRRF